MSDALVNRKKKKRKEKVEVKSNTQHICNKKGERKKEKDEER